MSFLQVSLKDVVISEDAMYAFYSSHGTIVTSWLIDEDSLIIWETDVDGVENGMLYMCTFFVCCYANINFHCQHLILVILYNR